VEIEFMRLILTALPHASDALFSGTAHITQSRYSIGRGENNDWVLSDAKRLISKNHCVIEPAEDGFRLVDRSTNGTTVSGKPVDRNTGHMLRNGDEIELGPYKFRAALDGAGRSQITQEFAFEDPSAPKITSILHDVAPSGVGAKSMIPGGQKDAFEDMGRRKGRYPSGSLAADLGWDGPPPGDPDVVRPAPAVQVPYREFADRMEQGPAERVLIDLPRHSVLPAPEPQPASVQFIPDNWLDEDDSQRSPAELPQGAALGNESEVIRPWPAAPPDLSLRAVTEVKNIEIPETAPAPARAFRAQAAQGARADGASPAAEIVAAFCDGLGIQEHELAHMDSVRFFHNAGRALSVSISELQNTLIGKSRAAALLEMSGGSLGRTPWIFSLGGEDKARVAHAVAAFLAEAEPRDLEMMRADHKDVQAMIEQLSLTIIGLVESLQQTMSVAELEKHVSKAAKAIPSLKKAALWDAFLSQSGLFPQGAKTKGQADLLPILKAEMKKHESAAK
jgi:type VI secretion system protein